MSERHECRLTRVHDGDTIICNHHLADYMGVEHWIHNVRLRFARINAPEIKNQDRTNNPAGIASRDYLAALLQNGGPDSLTCELVKGDNYGGREVAEVYKGSANLSDAMVAAGHAIYKMYAPDEPMEGDAD